MSYPNPYHAYYEPSNEFIQRHSLALDEAEVFAQLSAPGRMLLYNKETGKISLFATGADKSAKLFAGFLPDEAALESIISYTRW